MEITRKGKMLRDYGISLADTYFEEKRELRGAENRDMFVMLSHGMGERIDSKLAEINHNFNPRESEKIIGYFADRLLEKGYLNFAYNVYQQINSKKTKTIERLFPQEMLEIKNPIWD